MCWRVSALAHFASQGDVLTLCFLKRIAFASFGAVLLPLLLLPLAFVETVGGHSVLFLGIFASPVGILAGCAYSDVRRHFQPRAIVVRTAAASMVLLVLYFVLFQIEDVLPFFKNDGWILIPLAGPLFAGGVSEFILKEADGPKFVRSSL